MNNKLIFNKVNEFICNEKPPLTISKLGFFGSYIKQDNEKTNDIDILVFENIELKNENELIERIIQSITKEDYFDFDVLNTYSDSVYLYLTELSNYLKIPLRIALGPVINEPNMQYLHINASFNESLWRKFSYNLPIHAHLISTNYASVIGKEPYQNKLTKKDFLEYIILMDKRFSNFKITKSYLRKVLKSLALFNKFNSADYQKCLDFLTEKNIISDELIASITDANNESELSKVYNCLKPHFYA